MATKEPTHKEDAWLVSFNSHRLGHGKVLREEMVAATGPEAAIEAARSLCATDKMRDARYIVIRAAK